MIGTHSRFTKQVLDYAQSFEMASGGNLNLEVREMGSMRYSPWYRLSTSDIETAPSNAPRIARLVMGSRVQRLK